MGNLNKTKHQVPSNRKPFSFDIRILLLIIIFYLSLIFNFAPCENILHDDFYKKNPSTLSSGYYSINNDKQDNVLSTDGSFNDIYDILQPTPALGSNVASFLNKEPLAFTKKIENISPARVISRYNLNEPESHLFSPIFGMRLQNHLDEYNKNPEIYNNYLMPSSGNTVETGNSFDLVEQGSGFGFNLEDTSAIMEDSTTINEFDPMNISPTPLLTPTLNTPSPSYPTTDDNSLNNKAPILIRKIPKLVVIAGQVWRYSLPVDTFTDEDGDLRYLETRISVRKYNSDTPSQNEENNSKAQDNDKYYDWLQYGSSSLILYGFPTENDVGKHELILTVTDKMGASSEEVIEINVRQHQSARAFTHMFVINSIEWNKDRYPSMVDAIGDFVKRISTQVLTSEQPFRDFILQSYNINNISGSSQEQLKSVQNKTKETNLSFNLSWSNSSIPIHPCNLSAIETLAKSLINLQSLSYDWSLDKDPKLNLQPSSELIKALGPEFSPTSISIHLQGTCEGRDLIGPIQSSESIFQLKTKIGQLNWILGQPIEYKIPDDVFLFNGSSTNNSNFSLTLHTIDGLTLDKDPFFSYLDFDSENRIIFGSPYDQDMHSGQRELMLTIWHLSSIQKSREVFIINVEAQDLTTINNRAFEMSLYLFSRSGLFGPKERVLLAHKMIGGIKLGNTEISRELEQPELLIVDIQRYSINLDSNMLENRYNLKYEDKVKKVTDTHYRSDLDRSSTKYTDYNNQLTYIYKYTWTNASIGYRGDCPVEVIKQHILGALENSMEAMQFNTPLMINDEPKNDSVLFYDRLRLYFEPESDLVHLRFEPIGACTNAFRLLEVGFSDVADSIDKEDLPLETSHDTLTANVIVPTTQPPGLETEDDVYWVIVVFIIFIVLFLTIIMLVKGIQIYCLNQDKKLENQLRLVQARQNSMYLSSMVLANQVNPNDICAQILPQNMNKSVYVVHDEEKGSRKPVILDNEKQLLTTSLMPTAVQMLNAEMQTTPIRQSFTSLDAGSTCKPPLTPQVIQSAFIDGKPRSMTLQRRPSGLFQQYMNQHNSMSNLNHSQSILTVASLATPLPIIPQGHMPIVYAQVPMLTSQQDQFQQAYPSLQRNYNQQRTTYAANHVPFVRREDSIILEQQNVAANNYNQKQQPNTNGNLINRTAPYHNNSSPSYSSSTSATTQSVISIQNVGKHDRTEV